MFPIIQVEKVRTEPLPNENCYLVGSNGIFKKVVNEFYTIILKNGQLPDLAEIKEEVDLHVTKLSERILKRVHAFFNDVNNKHKGEAVVVLLFNPITRRWAVKIPPQVPCGMSVKYDLEKGDAVIWVPGNGHEEMNVIHNQSGPLPDGLRDFRLFGSIHSHCDGTAFHSGTDDKDEFGFDGLHITLGKVSHPTPDISCRWMLAGEWKKAEPAGCIDFENNKIEVDAQWLERVTESRYTPTTPCYGYAGSYIERHGAGFSSPVHRQFMDDFGDDYGMCVGRGSHPSDTSSDPGADTKVMGKSEAPPDGPGAGKESRDEKKNSLSISSTSPDVAGGDHNVPPIHRLLSAYYTNPTALSWEEKMLVEICQEDMEILDFVESLNEAELQRLLCRSPQGNQERLRDFLETAASEQFDKIQVASEVGARAGASQHNLRRALEDD